MSRNKDYDEELTLKNRTYCKSLSKLGFASELYKLGKSFVLNREQHM